MDSRKFVLKETGIIAIGQAACVAVMIGIFALLGQFDRSVLIGGIAGGVLATLNFLFMAIGASLAADKAEAQDVAGGQKLLHLSQLLRYVLLAVILFVCIKSDFCDALATVLPLVFVRPVLTVGEFFRK